MKSKNRMLEELGHILKLSQKRGWAWAKDIFAEIMHLIEQREWSGSTGTMNARFNTTIEANQGQGQPEQKEQGQSHGGAKE